MEAVYYFEKFANARLHGVTFQKLTNLNTQTALKTSNPLSISLLYFTV
jgi:hypothetical protein